MLDCNGRGSKSAGSRDNLATSWRLGLIPASSSAVLLSAAAAEEFPKIACAILLYAGLFGTNVCKSLLPFRIARLRMFRAFPGKRGCCQIIAQVDEGTKDSHSNKTRMCRYATHLQLSGNSEVKVLVVDAMGLC